ncbi:MAG: phosphatase PAP2 family protein [Syntrophotaleaceae bacterium]
MRLTGRLRDFLRNVDRDSLVRWRPEFWFLVVILLIASGLWAFAELADEVMEGEVRTFDRLILLALRTPGDLNDPVGPPWLEEMVRDFTSFGDLGVLTFILLVAAGYLFLVGKKRTIVLMVTAILGGSLLSFFLKLGFDRPRPDLVAPQAETLFSAFPSGHSLQAAAAYLIIGVILARTQPKAVLKIYLMGVAILLTLIVGLSRIYLGVHWPTDVLAGWTMGAVWALLCWLVATWLEHRGKLDREESDQ